MRKNITDDERFVEALNRFINGESLSKIAKDIGLTKQYLSLVLKEIPLWEVYKKMHVCNKYKEFVNMIQRGMTIKEISKKLGKPESTIRSRLYKLRRAGCIDDAELRELLSGNRVTLKDKIKALYNAGFKPRDIAKELDISIYTVHTYLYKLRSGILK